ncbi:hypothetical protein SAMN02745947_03105 [Rhodococcus rhodochrous J3]|uniref:Uncharacterized protein n=1 Tax=Rhodococcus rhodochrous J3 TaxID=903528 RepID=A0ABY1MCF8_RHORH|nr:hypothetical protein SAMN02745947_03105 [Rhodococcus rhodochrous J3]
MSTQPGQWRLLDEAEAAALSLADESHTPPREG